MLRASVVGYGYWGPNLARNINNSPYFKLSSIVDQNSISTRKAKALFPQVEEYLDIDSLNLDNCDVAFVATPAKSHFDLCSKLLDKGIAVWVEKPATYLLSQSKLLAQKAKEKNQRIFVDHPYLYSPAVEKIREIISNGEIGRPLYCESQRANLGIFQPDVSVLFDLAVHDLSIFNFCLSEEKIWWISCSSSNPLSSGTDSIINMTIGYRSGITANISCNWLSPIKIRRTTIVGTKAALVFDDTESIEKLKIYKQEIDTSQAKDVDKRHVLVSYRSGDVISPRLSPEEPLQLAINDFGDCLVTGKNGRNELSNQLSVMEQLDLASISASKSGIRIYQDSSRD